MRRCACKAGFFSLRDCDQPAFSQCLECSRFICAEHTAPGGMMTCSDCRARSAQQEPEGDATYDDDWAYRYRHRYYASAGYGSTSWGSHRHTTYDHNDAQSFVAGNDEYRDDDPQGGFGDS